MDDYIDRWHELQDEIKRLQAEQAAIADKLMENMSVGEVQVSVSGKKVRKCDRGVLDADMLKENITPALWTRITKRVPVAALYKAEIERGKLSKATMDNCTNRSTSWIEKR